MMTDKQGGAIHFKLHNLPGWGRESEFTPLQTLNADRAFTEPDASSLIDLLTLLGESKKDSPSYVKSLDVIRELQKKYANSQAHC